MGDYFADVALVQSHVCDLVAEEVFFGVDDRFRAEFDADDLARMAGGDHAEGTGAAVEIVDDGAFRKHRESGVVELFSCEGVGLEEGAGADLKSEGALFQAQFFDDVIGSRKVHFIKICRSPFFRLVNAQKDRNFSCDRFADSIGVSVELGACESEFRVAGDIEDCHLLAGAGRFSESEIAEATRVGGREIGFETGALPPSPDGGEDIGKPGACEVAFSEVENVGFGLGDHEAEVALAAAVFRKGKLHLVPVAEGRFAGDDGVGLPVESLADALLFLFELGAVSHLLPAATATSAGMDAARFNAIGGRGEDFEQAPLFGEPLFAGEFEKDPVAGDHMCDFRIISDAITF